MLGIPAIPSESILWWRIREGKMCFQDLAVSSRSAEPSLHIQGSSCTSRCSYSHRAMWWQGIQGLCWFCVTGASLPISVSFAHLLLAFEKVLCDTFQLLWSTQDWFLCFAQKQSLTLPLLWLIRKIFSSPKSLLSFSLAVAHVQWYVRELRVY